MFNGEVTFVQTRPALPTVVLLSPNAGAFALSQSNQNLLELPFMANSGLQIPPASPITAEFSCCTQMVVQSRQQNCELLQFHGAIWRKSIGDCPRCEKPHSRTVEPLIPVLRQSACNGITHRQYPKRSANSDNLTDLRQRFGPQVDNRRSAGARFAGAMLR